MRKYYYLLYESYHLRCVYAYKKWKNINHFRIAIESEHPDETIEDIEKNRARLIGVYNTLRERDWFPNFGDFDSSNSGGYGTGPGDNFQDEIILFTSNFPEYTFLVYCFYWDNTDLEVFRINNNEIQLIYQTSFEVIKVSSLSNFSVHMTPDNVYISNDITELFQ